MWGCQGDLGHEKRKLSCLLDPSDAVCKLCPLSSELRILLLCGSDLLESFCIPGLWNEADVSSLWGEGENGRGILDLGFRLPSPSTAWNLLPPQSFQEGNSFT